jgi:hypothetical protein
VSHLRRSDLICCLPTLFGFAFAHLQCGLTSGRAYGAGLVSCVELILIVDVRGKKLPEQRRAIPRPNCDCRSVLLASWREAEESAPPVFRFAVSHVPCGSGADPSPARPEPECCKRSNMLRFGMARRWENIFRALNHDARETRVLVSHLRRSDFICCLPTLFGFAFARLQCGLTSGRAYGAGSCRRLRACLLFPCLTQASRSGLTHAAPSGAGLVSCVEIDPHCGCSRGKAARTKTCHSEAEL